MNPNAGGFLLQKPVHFWLLPSPGGCSTNPRYKPGSCAPLSAPLPSHLGSKCPALRLQQGSNDTAGSTRWVLGGWSAKASAMLVVKVANKRGHLGTATGPLLSDGDCATSKRKPAQERGPKDALASSSQEGRGSEPGGSWGSLTKDQLSYLYIQDPFC